MIVRDSLFQTEVLLNAMSDMPAGNTGTPYTGCFENGTITIDSSKRYTTNLDMARCGKRGVKIGSTPNASGAQNFPRNWGYSCWNNGSGRSGYVIALHRFMLPSGSVAPEYDSNNPQKKSSIYAIIEIPNASDGTVPTSAERTAFLNSIGTALSADNVTWGTVTSDCGVLPAGVTTDPECTTDTYLGGFSYDDCGGHPSDGGNPDDKKKCGSYSDSTLVAGDTYKYKRLWGGGYTTETVPAGTFICTYDAHDLPHRSNQWREDHPVINCTANEDKVLGRGWVGTNGVWECIPKFGCKDLHNTNYAHESLRTHKSTVCDAGDCITGADKKILGSGDGSCIKILQSFSLIKSETGCCGGGKSKAYNDCKCRYELGLGKSGWGGYILSFNNFEGPSGQTCAAGTCDQWKAGRSGSARFDTLAQAQAAFDTMKAGAEASMRPIESDDATESDTDNGDNDNGNGNGITPDLCEAVICSDINRDDHADAEPLYDTSVQDCCGACSTGYEEDDNGECQSVDGDEEENNTLKYALIGGGALMGLLVLKKMVS